ncbi:hypothetical protein ACK8OR_01835 [Jannaschia sp. KMU-145]|uniref:hypothetical protein n=1 Tax=Jannaschia halovivens TaxID=3388667 RepID=UPI00396AFE4C
MPATVLLRQGIYLQTCAHIELLAWRIIQMTEGERFSPWRKLHEYLQLKLNTRGIVKRLRKCATKCHPAWGVRIAALADAIADGLPNRNLAAHGAWQWHPSGKLQAEHYLRLEGEMRYISARYSSRQIDMALDDANLILVEAVRIHDALAQSGRRYVSLTAASLRGADHSNSGSGAEEEQENFVPEQNAAPDSPGRRGAKARQLSSVRMPLP